MGKPFPLRFELPSPAKCLRVERVNAKTSTYNPGDPYLSIDLWGTDKSGHWRLWLMANGDFTLGTFIQLLDNGQVNHVTWHEDGTESVLEVTNV